MKRILSFSSFIAVLLLISVTVMFFSCKKEEPNDPDPTEPFHIQFEVNGTTIRYEDEVDNYGNGPGRRTLNEADNTCRSEYTLFSRNQSDPDYIKSSIVIELVKKFSQTPSYNDIFNIWGTGTYEYGMWSEDSIAGSTEGVVFTYTDETGKVWSSGLLFGEQNGAEFQITEHRAVSDELFNAISKGSFSCEFHDGSGNSLTITNGEFKARTIQDL